MLLTRPEPNKNSNKEKEALTVRHLALLALVTASGFLVVSQVYLIIPLIEGIAKRFELAPASATLVGSAFGFTYAAGFLVFGPLSDRVGRKRVIVFGLIATALATLMVAKAPTFELLLVARAGQGFAASTFPPAALSLVTEELPLRHRPFGVSLMSFVFLAAAPLAQFLAAQATGGLSAIMDQLVPLYLISATGLFFAVGRRNGDRDAKDVPAGGKRISLLHDARMVAAWTAAGTVLFGFISFHVGVQALGSSLDNNVQTLRLVGLPPLLLTFAAAPVTRRFGSPVTAILGLVVAALALGISITGTPNLITAASMLLSAGVAFAVPGLIATVAGRSTSSNRGLALSVYSFLLFLGASVAPPAAQTLAQIGLVPVGLLPATMFALAALGLALSGKYRNDGRGRSGSRGLS